MPRRHVPTPHHRFQPAIPCAQKRRFRNEAEALKAIELTQLNLSAPELRVYRCPYCDKWHLSSSQR